MTERLQTVKGVGGVQLAGFRDREIRVWINTDSLEAYDLTTKEIKSAIYTKHGTPGRAYRDSDQGIWGKA